MSLAKYVIINLGPRKKISRLKIIYVNQLSIANDDDLGYVRYVKRKNRVIHQTLDGADLSEVENFISDNISEVSNFILIRKKDTDSALDYYSDVIDDLGINIVEAREFRIFKMEQFHIIYLKL